MKKIKIITFLFTMMTIATVTYTNVQAETLADYENLLKKYKNEQAKNQSEINKTDAAINSAKIEIENIKKELIAMTQEVEKMKQEIVAYNQEIIDKSLETKELFQYLQMSQSENSYLEYALGATDMTDLIYRISVVEQLVEYNKSKIENLEQLIENNKAREIQLAEKEKQLAVKRETAANRISNLTGVKASLNSNSVSVSQQIKIYDEIVSNYKKLGCKSTDIIGVDCAKSNNAGEFVRPINSGYITSEFGSRWGGIHRGLDISNKTPYSTRIYPVANGTIKAKYYDYYGALTIVIEHKTITGKYFSSLYTHMSSFATNVFVGKSVTINDYIGIMGNTGYSQGAHLHLEVVPCRLYNLADQNCGTWAKYTSYVSRIYNNGSYKGPRDYIYFPAKNATFTSRR